MDEHIITPLRKVLRPIEAPFTLYATRHNFNIIKIYSGKMLNSVARGYILSCDHSMVMHHYACSTE